MNANLRGGLSHDPAQERFRCPLGACPCGAQLRLALAVRCPGVRAARLVLFDDQQQQELEMSRDQDGFWLSLTLPEQPTVLWYYFQLTVNDETWYFGANSSGRGSGGDLCHSKPPAFQITVYDRDFTTPAWFRQGVLYQIFPDRFAPGDPAAVAAGVACHRALGRRLDLHQSWSEPVAYRSAAGEQEYYPRDFYGGTLDAIRQKLPYLRDLGVTVLYLNPIFEADSNHRYNTADYCRVDPILGSNEDFTALAQAARQQGIRILLDGVFSHTGADSRYFDRYGRYDGSGACQSPDSPYFSWYDFQRYPDRYRCWWGFESLPEVDENDPSWQEFIISGENSVIRQWLARGAAGFRLDVADELPDPVLALIRQAVKESDPEGVVLGEVWEDATNKRSYGALRHYALGQALDAVMNYPLRNALVDFLLKRQDAYQLAAFLLQQRLNYPPPLYYSLMNLLSSHDIERIRTVLATRLSGRELGREQQAQFVVSDSQDQRGWELQRLAVILQYSLPGLPSLYYGDEEGMQGFLDPFNRAPFTPGPRPLTGEYRALAALRHGRPALNRGAVAIAAGNSQVIALLRTTAGGSDAFGQDCPAETLVSLVNRSSQPQRVVLDLFRPGLGLDEQRRQRLMAAGYNRVRPLFTVPAAPAAFTAALDCGLLDLVLEPGAGAMAELSAD